MLMNAVKWALVGTLGTGRGTQVEATDRLARGDRMRVQWGGAISSGLAAVICVNVNAGACHWMAVLRRWEC